MTQHLWTHIEFRKYGPIVVRIDIGFRKYGPILLSLVVFFDCLKKVIQYLLFPSKGSYIFWLKFTHAFFIAMFKFLLSQTSS